MTRYHTEHSKIQSNSRSWGKKRIAQQVLKMNKNHWNHYDIHITCLYSALRHDSQIFGSPWSNFSKLGDFLFWDLRGTAALLFFFNYYSLISPRISRSASMYFLATASKCERGWTVEEQIRVLAVFFYSLLRLNGKFASFQRSGLKKIYELCLHIPWFDKRSIDRDFQSIIRICPSVQNDVSKIAHV